MKTTIQQTTEGRSVVNLEESIFQKSYLDAIIFAISTDNVSTRVIEESCWFDHFTIVLTMATEYRHVGQLRWIAKASSIDQTTAWKMHGAFNLRQSAIAYQDRQCRYAHCAPQGIWVCWLIPVECLLGCN